MKTLISTIKTALDDVEENGEIPWAKPWTSPRSAPSGFPYGEKELLSVEDARRVKQTAEALISKDRQKRDLEEKYKKLNVDVTAKIAQLRKEDRYAELSKEIEGHVNKLGTEILDEMGEATNKLYRQGNTLMAVSKILEKPTGKLSQDKQDFLKEAMLKYVTEDVVGNILKEADEAYKAFAESMKVLKNQVQVWPAPKDIQKKVKQVETVPAAKTAGIMDFLKGMWDSLKGLYQKAKDAVAGFVSSVNEGEELTNQMEGVLQEAGVEDTASKVLASDSDLDKSIGTVQEVLEKGISFPEGIYSFSGPLTDHIIENLQNNPDISYDNISEIVYTFVNSLSQFDYLELPDGSTFKREFSVNNNYRR